MNENILKMQKHIFWGVKNCRFVWRIYRHSILTSVFLTVHHKCQKCNLWRFLTVKNSFFNCYKIQFFCSDTSVFSWDSYMQRLCHLFRPSNVIDNTYVRICACEYNIHSLHSNIYVLLVADIFWRYLIKILHY